MFYYLYQITNKVNGNIYVGVHKTKNLDDGYMGSGKVIKHAIEKYGVDNFEKVILDTFDDSESMYAREREMVTDEFLARDDVYNIRRGGHGGFDYLNKMMPGPFKGHKHSKETKEKLSAISSLYRHSDETIEKMKVNNFSVKYPELQREHARKAGNEVSKLELKKQMIRYQTQSEKIGIKFL